MIRWLVLAVGGSFAVVVLLIWFYPSSAEWDEANPFWNGLSALQQSFAVQDVTGATLPRDPTGTTVIVVAARPALSGDLPRLRDYASRGGQILLLDDHGVGNDYAAGLGVAMRFDDALLLDPLINYRQPSLPRAEWKRADGQSGPKGSLVLNGATALLGTGGAAVLARSSPLSFVDRVGSGVRDSADPAGPLPVAASIALGRGRVVAIADASLPMNAMLGLGDNEAFLREQIGRDRVFLYTPGLPASSIGSARRTLRAVRQTLGQPLLSALLCATIVVIVLTPGMIPATIQQVRSRRILPRGLGWLRARQAD